MDRNEQKLAPRELTKEEVFHACDQKLLNFETTDEVKEIALPVGQSRAVDAIRLGADVDADGFNIFVTGSSGLGKHHIVQGLMKELPELTKPLYDWCYVHNFKHPHKPKLLQLPAGKGFQLKTKISKLIDELLQAIPTILQSDEYKHRATEIQHTFLDKEEHALLALKTKAKRKNFHLSKTTTGYSILPQRDDKPLSSEDFDTLPIEEQTSIERDMQTLRTELLAILRRLPLWEKEKRDQLKALEREFIALILDQLINQLDKEFSGIDYVQGYLQELSYNILDNIQQFSSGQDQSKEERFLSQLRMSETSFLLYEVNILVDNGQTDKPKIIYEKNPTYNNLLGTIDHRSELGTLVTNFSLIKAGSLQKANGGVLIIDAIQLLNKPFIWDALKRALLSKEVFIQPLEQMLSYTPTSSLEPEAMPLDVKVVLIGDRMLYYLLKQYDPQFSLLFKVQADCAEDMERTADSSLLYTQLIKSILLKEKLKPLSATAVARVIEYSSKRAADGEKLSLKLGELTSLLQEANYCAEKGAQELVDQQAILQAIENKKERAGYLKQRVFENILRGFSVIKTDGSMVGEMNGLAVILIDDTSFGRPSRISATVQVGKGKIVNIERETDLSGPIHSKGIMILTAFLGQRFGQCQPIAIAATITFEQSYGLIEGDSASAAELCVLLSAIGQIELSQSIAMTGAVDQHGNLEAIGGVNEKIEGFFDICKARGLTGEQGVIIPATNIPNLMLKQEVREAISQKQFRIWALAHVDQAMALLSGIPIGELDEGGNYPEDSVNYQVNERLQRINQIIKEFTQDKEGR